MDKDLFAEAVNLTNIPIVTPSWLPSGKPAYCTTIYNNTIAENAAEAIAMHCGCAAIDAALVGIVCHAAVTVWQIAANNKAWGEYEACR